MYSTLIFSQSPVYNTLLADYKPGAYYKDTANELNKFEGTWLYTNGTTSFKLVLQKRTMQLIKNYYKDVLVGGYQYIENGVEKVNWLSDVNATHAVISHHKVTGNYFVPNRRGVYPAFCNTCPDDEKILSVSIGEPHAPGRFLNFRFKLNVGSPNQIIIYPMHRDMLVRSPDEPAQYYVLPLDMNFTLTKQ